MMVLSLSFLAEVGGLQSNNIIMDNNALCLMKSDIVLCVSLLECVQ